MTTSLPITLNISATWPKLDLPHFNVTKPSVFEFNALPPISDFAFMPDTTPTWSHFPVLQTGIHGMEPRPTSIQQQAHATQLPPDKTDMGLLDDPTVVACPLAVLGVLLVARAISPALRSIRDYWDTRKLGREADIPQDIIVKYEKRHVWQSLRALGYCKIKTRKFLNNSQEKAISMRCQIENQPEPERQVALAEFSKTLIDTATKIQKELAKCGNGDAKLRVIDKYSETVLQLYLQLIYLIPILTPEENHSLQNTKEIFATLLHQLAEEELHDQKDKSERVLLGSVWDTLRTDILSTCKDTITNLPDIAKFLETAAPYMTESMHPERGIDEKISSCLKAIDVLASWQKFSALLKAYQNSQNVQAAHIITLFRDHLALKLKNYLGGLLIKATTIPESQHYDLFNGHGSGKLVILLNALSSEQKVILEPTLTEFITARANCKKPELRRG